MIRARTEEELARTQAWMRETFRPAPSGPPVNVALATTLGDEGLLQWRGVAYEVPPVPFVHAARLHVLMAHLDQLAERTEGWTTVGAGAVPAYVAARKLTEAVTEVMRHLVRPLGRWGRWTWRWRRNPFRDAEWAELRDLAHFFFFARTRRPVAWVLSIRAPVYLWQMSPGTSLTGSATTAPSPAGSLPAATPPRGVTTSWGA